MTTHPDPGRIRASRRGAAVGLLSGLLLGLLVLAVPFGGSAGAAPAGAPCVALVVDTGQGKPAEACVAYSKGMTGTQLLTRAGSTIRFASNGLVCQINGAPKTCTEGDKTHYWSYYLRKPGAAPGKWDYAPKGPADIKPVAGETEAWVYVNGAARNPAAIPYATIAKAAGPIAPASKAPASSSKAPASPAPSSADAGTPTASPLAAPPAKSATSTKAAKSADSGTAWWKIAVPIIVVVAIATAGLVVARNRTRRA